MHEKICRCLQSEEEDSEEEGDFDFEKYKAHLERTRKVRFLSGWAADGGIHRCSSALA